MRAGATMSGGTTTELRDAFDSPRAKQAYVRRLFATIAGRYDLITVLLSYGQDHRWKQRLAEMSGAAAGTRALDLACGTGDIAYLLARRGARVTGLDVTGEMLRRARGKGQGVAFVAGDMMALPFPDAHFDVVTAGYGIRNVPELAPALAEIRRVLRPGGVFLSLDFNRPANPIVRGVYLGYLTAVGGLLGAVLHRDPDTYRYIPASIRRYPGAPRVCRLLIEQGFERCTYIPVLGGLMAIHRAT
jgi:ubiquinone/menaquinone biosynthesis methyltransferase